MPERIAFRMNLNPGQAAEYEKRHDEIFPELAQALKAAGVMETDANNVPTQVPLKRVFFLP